MPTLLIDDTFAKDEKAVLSTAFRSNCESLGIEEVDATVELRRIPYSNDPCHCAMMTKVARDRYLVVVNGHSYNLPKAISALGHETVHMRQYLTGKMEDCQEGGIRWGGKYFPQWVCQSMNFYRDLPWEVEAHGLQDTLYNRAMNAIRRRHG